jgi:hypothetical protein
MRRIASIGLTVALVLWLGGPHIPGWLLAVAVVGSMVLGLLASLEQKRIERDFVRSRWRGLKR